MKPSTFTVRTVFLPISHPSDVELCLSSDKKALSVPLCKTAGISLSNRPFNHKSIRKAPKFPTSASSPAQHLFSSLLQLHLSNFGPSKLREMGKKDLVKE